jgi:hypothetical protein
MLKSYKLPSAGCGEGWAIIVIDTDSGFFATVSAFGNYAYLWTSTGCEFRKFLIGLYADYLCKKLLHGRSDIRSIEAMAFCTKVFPRFTEMLKKELEVEASDLKALEDGRSSFMPQSRNK